jgi:hypothetical protein
MIHSNFKEALLISSSASNKFSFNNDKTGHIILYRLNPGAKISKSYISEAVTLAIAAIPFNCFS